MPIGGPPLAAYLEEGYLDSKGCTETSQHTWRVLYPHLRARLTGESGEPRANQTQVRSQGWREFQRLAPEGSRAHRRAALHSSRAEQQESLATDPKSPRVAVHSSRFKLRTRTDFGSSALRLCSSTRAPRLRERTLCVAHGV